MVGMYAFGCRSDFHLDFEIDGVRGLHDQVIDDSVRKAFRCNLQSIERWLKVGEDVHARSVGRHGPRKARRGIANGWILGM